MLRRFGALAAAERDVRWTRSLGGSAWAAPSVSGLLVAARFEGGGHAIGARLVAVERAVRRAAEALYIIRNNAPLDAWPRPMHPRDGGLEPAYAAAGSMNVILQAYGYLATLASSQPVALAGLVSTTIDAFQLGVAGARWTLRRLGDDELIQPPLPSLSGDGERWEERTTKSLQPVLLEAIQQGRGLDFSCGDLRLVVLPASDARQDGPPGANPR
jgi:hypothetical protein